MTEELKYVLTSMFVIVLIIYIIYIQFLNKRREKFINSYLFPNRVSEKIKSLYPHLTNNDIDLVLIGLKEYFIVCNDLGLSLATLPSRVIDIAWHEFTLIEDEYRVFCKKAFAEFLPYSASEAMESKESAQEGIQKVWTFACHRESIVPHSPNKIPLIFHLDKSLKIEDGFHYSLELNNYGEYCVKNIGQYRGSGTGYA